MVDYSFKEDFVYKHENPYHERLGEFGDLISALIFKISG